MKLRKTAQLNGIILMFRLASGFSSAGFTKIHRHNSVSGSTKYDLKPNSRVSGKPRIVPLFFNVQSGPVDDLSTRGPTNLR